MGCVPGSTTGASPSVQAEIPIVADAGLDPHVAEPERPVGIDRETGATATRRASPATSSPTRTGAFTR